MKLTLTVIGLNGAVSSCRRYWNPKWHSILLLAPGDLPCAIWAATK